LFPGSPLAMTRGLKQEPGAPLGFVDPVFQQACGGDIAVLVAKAVELAHVHGEPLVVLAKLREHVQRCHIVCVVVEDAFRAVE